MNKAVLFTRQYLPFIFITLFFFLAIIFSQLTLFKSQAQILSVGLTLDLLVTIPVCYFLLIRNSEIPKTTIAPVFILGLVIGSFAIPSNEQQLLIQFKRYVLPIVEIGAISYVFLKVRSIYSGVNAADKSSNDFYTILKSVSANMLPQRMVSPFATEVAIIYYGFFNWRKVNYEQNQFTYHKRSGSGALFAILIMIVVIETFAVHILLVKWSIIAANILTFLSIYTILQLFGFSRSLKHRPIIVNDEHLKLRYGILNETEINLSDIEEIALSRQSITDDTDAIKLSQLGELESHNIIITVKSEHQMQALYGFKKSYKKIAFHVDEKEKFKLYLEEAVKRLK